MTLSQDYESTFVPLHVIQLYAKNDELYDSSEKCISLLFLPEAILSIASRIIGTAYWPKLESRLRSRRHYNICQPAWKRSRTISQGIDRWWDVPCDNKYYEMIIIGRAWYHLHIGRHTLIFSPPPQARSRYIDAIDCRHRRLQLMDAQL